MLLRLSTAVLSLLLAEAAPAQLARVNFAGLPTNLLADFGQFLWVPGNAPDEFLVLAPFGGTPAQQFPFTGFLWNPHAMMQLQFPGGWFEVQFQFPLWAYLSSAPCAQQPAPGNTLPHGGINSTWDYGPPLFTGPVLSVDAPLPGWVMGSQGVFLLRGPTGPTLQNETFALYLRDYDFHQLNGCVGSTPMDWVAVYIRFALVRH